MSLEIPSETQEKPRATAGTLFKNRNFILLSTGQGISSIGDFVYSMTVLVWVYVLTHSAGAVSGVLIAQYTPVFLLGPVAGVFVDRWNRRTVMIVSDVLRALVALLPLFAPLSLRLPTIYSSVFLIAVFSRFFMPARSGVMQVVVPLEQQGQAASVGQATFALSFIIGPAIATPLYFLVGPIVACSINAVSFFVSALCLLAIQASRERLHPYVASAKNGVAAVAQELAAGFRLLVTSRVLLMVTLLALIAMLGAGALNALDIIFVSQRLHVSTSLYGPLTAVAGLGTLIGAILAGMLTRRIKPGTMLNGSVFLLGAGIVLYSLQTWFVPALVILFLSSIPQGGIDVGFAPLMMSETPEEMMGRVQSVLETAMFGMSLLSIALAGYFGQFVPVYIIYLVCGALIALAGVFGSLVLPKEAGSQKAIVQ